MEWPSGITDAVITTLAASIAGIAKWVHTMSMKVESNTERISDVCDRQDRCEEICHDTRERLSLSEQDRGQIHDVLADMKDDLKKILWHVRPFHKEDKD